MNIAGATLFFVLTNLLRHWGWFTQKQWSMWVILTTHVLGAFLISATIVGDYASSWFMSAMEIASTVGAAFGAAVPPGALAGVTMFLMFIYVVFHLVDKSVDKREMAVILLLALITVGAGGPVGNLTAEFRAQSEQVSGTMLGYLSI